MGVRADRLGARDWALAVVALVATWFEVSVGPAAVPVPGAIAGLAALAGAAAPAWRRRHPVPAVATAAFGLHDLLAGRSAGRG